jgi:hypothetical protein
VAAGGEAIEEPHNPATIVFQFDSDPYVCVLQILKPKLSDFNFGFCGRPQRDSTCLRRGFGRQVRIGRIADLGQSCLTKKNNRVKLYLPNPENIRSGGPKFLGRIAIWRGVTLSALALQLTS